MLLAIKQATVTVASLMNNISSKPCAQRGDYSLSRNWRTCNANEKATKK
jgi:hypothetical protein